MSKSINENKVEKEKIFKMLVKRGDTPIDARYEVNKSYDFIKKRYPKASVSKKAEIISSLSKFESVKEAMSPKVKRMMINAINDEAAMDDFLKKYGKYIPKKLNKSIMRYRDDIYDAERGYGDDRVAKKYLIKIFMKYINEGTCGYGLEGELGEEPAGPHLLKKTESRTKSLGEKDLMKYLMKRFKFNKKKAIDTMKKAGFDTSMLKEQSVLEKCQKGYMTHPTRKTKILFGKRYPNCVKKEGVDTMVTVEQAGKILDNLCINCGDFANEDLRKWFKQKWVNIGKKTKSGKHPPCGTSGEKRGYAKCVPASKAARMTKKQKASATRRKRAAQTKAGRGGRGKQGAGAQGRKPIMVKTDKK